MEKPPTNKTGTASKKKRLQSERDQKTSHSVSGEIPISSSYMIFKTQKLLESTMEKVVALMQLN